MSGVVGPSARPTPTTHTRRVTGTLVRSRRRTLPNPARVRCATIPVVLSELLHPLSPTVAAAFADVPVPVALRGPDPAPTTHGTGPTDLGDAATSVVILAGPAATRDAAGLHRLADVLGAPVANTWGAKGICPWDDPHHMGTCGLQRDDFALLGLAGFDVVLAIGIDPAESPVERFGLTRVAEAAPGRLDALADELAPRLAQDAANDLYTRIAAIAQPGYVDASVPRHPARAVMDLKQSLGPSTRVTAQPGLAGLWVARTFPTDRMGSVIVPAHDRPGVGAAVGVVSALRGTDTVAVVQGPVDDATAALLDVATAHGLPLRLEVWTDEVDWARTDDLVAAAGPVVAWT